MTTQVKVTKEFQHAFDVMNDSWDHVFLTGRAGTGKSTLLQYFRSKTAKKHVVLAPTGVAALNVKGQTIHSFFGFTPLIRLDRVRRAPAEKRPLFRNLETVVIDEISMVRADLLDCVDKALRLNRDQPNVPFGGVQMIFIGDLYQLPPVLTRHEEALFFREYPSPYFFSANVMRDLELQLVELKKVHRQTQKEYVELLERVRTNTLLGEDVQAWNTRHDPFFDPADDPGYIHLTTTNKMANQRNAYELKRLPGKAVKLKARSSGELPDRRMPSEPELELKEGARVMFTTNDSEKRWVNGTLGTIRRIKKKGLAKFPVLTVELEDGCDVEVSQHTWEMFEYESSGDGIEQSLVGSYTQYPLTLAWAVTIHKGQGKTFDNVLVDVGWGTFAHGQMYVALSRCTTFEGLVLLKPFAPKDVILDEVVERFMNRPM